MTEIYRVGNRTYSKWLSKLDEDTLRKVLLRGVESDGLRPYDWATTLQQEYVAPIVTTAEVLKMVADIAAKLPPTPRIILHADHKDDPLFCKGPQQSMVCALTKITVEGGDWYEISYDQAAEIHKTHPMVIMRVLSETCAELRPATEFDGSFPLQLPRPPYPCEPAPNDEEPKA